MKNEVVAELERIFEILNNELFEGKLQPVPFAIQTRKKLSIKWVAERNTILVGTDFPKLEMMEIPGIILHEMIHISNAQRGIIDVTTNQYHNSKHFLRAALEVGLVVVKHKTQGWSITSTIYPRNVVEQTFIRIPSREKQQKLGIVYDKLCLNRAIFRMGRTELRKQINAEKPNKTFFLKYQCNCPPPHNSIRSGRRPDGPNALNIQCLDCRSEFTCVTELDND